MRRQNPAPASATVTYMASDGAHPQADAGKKIMVERAMYWNTRGAGTDTIGGYSD